MRLSRLVLITGLLMTLLLCACAKDPEQTTTATAGSPSNLHSENASVPATAEVTTEAPTTEAPTTEAHATEVPTTEATTTSDPSGREYREKQLKYHEPWDYSYILSRAEETIVDSFSFCFAQDISPEMRETFISAQQELNEALGFEGPATFILTDYRDRADSDNGVGFFLPGSIRSWQQILITLQLMQGSDANYGLLYGWANRLAKELGWEEDLILAPSPEEIQECFQQDPGRLNLFYPCFIAPYSTEVQILCAKALARQIGDELESPNEESFLEKLKETAAAWDMDLISTYLRFLDGGYSSPLMIRTRFFEEYLSEDYSRDYAFHRMELSGFLIPNAMDWEINMTELIRVHEKTDALADIIRGYLDYEKEGLAKVIFENIGDDKKESGWNWYRSGQRTIYLETIYSLLHEYVHFLHFRSSANPYYIIQWHTEALSTYFGWEMHQDLENRLEEEGVFPEADNAQSVYVDLFYELWIASGETPVQRLYYDEVASSNYAAYYVVGAYLAQTYGDENFARMIVFPEEMEEITGKSWEEVLADWTAYVEEYQKKAAQE